MKNIIILIVFLVFSSCNRTEKVNKKQDDKLTYERIAIQGNNNYYGYLPSKNDTIIPLGKYDYLDSLDVKGMIRTHLNGKEGFIDINQNIVIPFDYNKASSFSYNLATVRKEKDGKVGYINRKGELVIDYRFDYARLFFKCGLADVTINNKTGFINRKGDVIVPIEYDYVISTDVDDFVAVSKNNKLAFFDCKGKQLTSFVFDKIHKRNTENNYVIGANGLILVSRNDEFSYLDNNFKTIIPYGKYDYAETFTKNRLAIVRNKEKYGIIDKNGKLKIPLEYSLIEHPTIYSYELNEFITKKNGKYGLFDRDANTILENIYDEINWDKLELNGIQTDYYLYKENGKYGAINTNGEVLIPFDFDELTEFNYQSFTIAKKKGMYGVINSNANIIIPFEYDKIDCNERKHWCTLLTLEKDNKTSLANVKGDVLIPSEYQEITPCFYEPKDRFIVKKNNKYGIIDKHKNIIVPIIYNSISNWVEYSPKGHFISINGKKGFMSRQGEITIEPIYDNFDFLGEFIRVSNNSKYGLLNTSKELILPIEYDRIYLDWFELEYERKEVNEFYAQKKGKYYLINSKGKVIKENIPFKDIKGKINNE